MTEKIRFGIVGSGMISAMHAQAIQSVPSAELVAIAGSTPAKVQKLADTYHVKAYTGLQEMLQNEQLDVVNVCTPSGLHADHACQSMRAGCHVIVEKPMEITREHIDEMLRVQLETGRKLAVISQHRFDESSQTVYGHIAQQDFGRLVMGNASIPWWRTQQYYESGAWRGTWALDGGGVLINQSIHSIDVLQWLMGPVRSIYAYTDTLAHCMETEDVAVAILRFANGALGTITATTGAYPGVTTRIEVFGDKGSAVIEDDRLSYLHVTHRGNIISASGVDAQNKEGITEKKAAASNNPAAISVYGHAIQIADMIRAIRVDGTPLIDGYAARHAVEIILGIYESARMHKEVQLSSGTRSPIRGWACKLP